MSSNKSVKAKLRKLTSKERKLLKKNLKETAISVEEAVKALERAKRVSNEVLKRRYTASRTTGALFFYNSESGSISIVI
jgi:hypothetical protein